MSNFYNQASWVLVPSGIEEDIVFAQKPISGLGDLTFTRASDATYTDASGVVRRSPYNLVTWSEDFTNAAWQKVASGTGAIPVVTANAGIAPNGTTTAERIVFNAGAAGASLIAQDVAGGVGFTFSIYLKSNTSSSQNIQLRINSTPGVTITVTTEWQRFTVTSTLWASATRDIGLDLRSAVGTTADLLVWGAQFVQGTEALDYFPTTNRQDVPRIDFRNADGTLSSCGRLLLEPQRTNSIRNSSMVGAVAGSPGTVPTNWGSVLGLNLSVAGLGTENGLPYIDLRLNGTATATTSRIRFDALNAIVGTVGQNWTASFWAKNVANPNPATSTQIRITERNSSQVAVNQGDLLISPTTNLQRFTYTRANVDATCAFVNVEIVFFHTVGVAYDFTIRIAAPQMELGAYATTWVPTTTAAVTRIKDDASKTGVSSIIGQSAGTIFWDINDLTGTPTSTGNPDFAIRNTAFTNWIGVTTNSFASPFRVVVRPTSGSIIDYTANINRAKAAVAWSSAGAVLYVNGAQVGTSAVNPNFSFDIIQMLGGIISYKTNQAAIFPTRLTNAELAQLTTL